MEPKLILAILESLKALGDAETTQSKKQSIADAMRNLR
jgi:hypothetical protein